MQVLKPYSRGHRDLGSAPSSTGLLSTLRAENIFERANPHFEPARKFLANAR